MTDFDNILNAGVALVETLSGDSFTHGGETFTGNFRTGNAMEQAEASSFSSHGSQSQTVVILYAARSQFSLPPFEWKNQKILRTTPTATEYIVASVNTDDPNVYAFVCVARK